MSKATMNPKPWQTRWEDFIHDVVSDFASGLTEREVTRKYSSSQVAWTGTLIDKNLFSPRSSVQMEMPRVVIPFDRGRTVAVDYLNLDVDERDKAAWDLVKVGDIVQFSTIISSGIEPFPGIEWSEYEGEASILVGTESSRILATGSR